LTLVTRRTRVALAKSLRTMGGRMNRKLTWSLVALMLCGLAAWSQVKKTDDEAEKTVAGLENKWLQSQKTNNPDMVAPLLADNFVNTGSDGKVTSKDESLANAKATKYDNVNYENLKVTIFGSTAIATGDFKAKGTDSSGKPMDVHERFTDTWVKMPNGQWQCVASHGSPVKM
jgi:ketosteroid isomerase-like protein